MFYGYFEFYQHRRFPFFVAVFFLLKLDKTLQNIGKSVNDLTEIIKIKLNAKD